jgi:hypothetical protein
MSKMKCDEFYSGVTCLYRKELNFSGNTDPHESNIFMQTSDSLLIMYNVLTILLFPVHIYWEEY